MIWWAQRRGETMQLLMTYYALLYRPVGKDGMSTWWIGAENRQPLVFPKNEVIIDLWQQTLGVPIEVLCDNATNHRVVAIPTGIKIENRKRFFDALLPYVWLQTPAIA